MKRTTGILGLWDAHNRGVLERGRAEEEWQTEAVVGPDGIALVDLMSGMCRGWLLSVRNVSPEESLLGVEPFPTPLGFLASRVLGRWVVGVRPEGVAPERSTVRWFRTRAEADAAFRDMKSFVAARGLEAIAGRPRELFRWRLVPLLLVRLGRLLRIVVWLTGVVGMVVVLTGWVVLASGRTGVAAWTLGAIVAGAVLVWRFALWRRTGHPNR